MDELDTLLNVVTAQEQLPRSVLDAYGFDADTMRVFTPRELLELYIGEDNR